MDRRPARRPYPNLAARHCFHHDIDTTGFGAVVNHPNAGGRGHKWMLLPTLDSDPDPIRHRLHDGLEWAVMIVEEDMTGGDARPNQDVRPEKF